MTKDEQIAELKAKNKQQRKTIRELKNSCKFNSDLRKTKVLNIRKLKTESEAKDIRINGNNDTIHLLNEQIHDLNVLLMKDNESISDLERGIIGLVKKLK